MTADHLRRRARRFRIERLINTIVGPPFAAAISLVFIAAAIFGEIPLSRIGCAIIAASLLHNFYRTMRTEWGMNPATDSLPHYRANLARRIELLRGFLYRDGLAMALGTILLTLGWLLAEPDRWSEAATACVIGVGLPIAVWAGNTRRIERLQQEIETVDRWTQSAINSSMPSS